MTEVDRNFDGTFVKRSMGHPSDVTFHGMVDRTFDGMCDGTFDAMRVLDGMTDGTSDRVLDATV